mgnify:CR=1 FL=1
MFRTAAIFNWTAAFLVGMFGDVLFELLDIAPTLHENNMFFHVCMFLVALMGVGHHWASSDFPAHANVVWLGFSKMTALR